MQPKVIENSSLYSVVEAGRLSIAPARALISFALEMAVHPMNIASYTPTGKLISANLEMIDRLIRHYPKPIFGINITKIDGKEVHIHENIVRKKTFCNLIHFKKANFAKPQRKMLVVAPLSGHYATLLRGTVEGLLPHFDVYITDWADAKHIPLKEGKFDFDDYLSYCKEFMEILSPDLNVMAVCQPAVPVISAIALMSSQNSKKLPNSMTLIGGPIDTRHSPTKVNNYAKSKGENWFEQNVITRVPLNYAGFGRPVYPGFLQLSGFMAMNLKRHIGEHVKLYQHLIQGDGESAEHHRKFYDEYLAVLDLPAEFYIQTIKIVFRDHSLPKGTLKVKGETVDLKAIKDVALIVIEGELDDISGVGQTKAAIDLCTNIPVSRKLYHFQKGAGHYGVFNGRKYREEIIPAIYNFLDKIDVKKPAKIEKAAPKKTAKNDNVVKMKKAK